MCSVIIQLDRTDGKVGVQVVISSAADDPACAGAAGAAVKAGMSNAQQSVDENVELLHAMRKLRAKKDVVLASRSAAKRFVIAAKISLQSEPVIQVAGKSGFPSAAVGERVAVEE